MSQRLLRVVSQRGAMSTIGDIHKIVWYGVAMSQKRNRKRRTVYIAHSMIMQRSGSKPVGRRRETRGAINMGEQEPTVSIKRTICTTNSHDETTPTPLHTKDQQHRQWQQQLPVTANFTNHSPANGHSIVAASPHRTASTIIEVQ